MTAVPSREVLITGGRGFIGGHCVRACKADGRPVTSLDIRPAMAGQGVEEIVGEAGLPRVLGEVRAGRYAGVVHMGGISSTLADDWDELRRVNVEQPLDLAEACATGGATFIYASSHSVYGTIAGRRAVREGDERDSSICSGPLNLYARSKLLLDDEMQSRWTSGLSWAGLRFTNVFGTGEERKGSMASILFQLVRRAARGETLNLFSDTLLASRDYVPVETVTATMLRLLDGSVPSGVYNLGSGVPISFATLLEWCADLVDAPSLAVSLLPNPVKERYQYWTCADMTMPRDHLGDVPDLATTEIRTAVSDLYRSLAAVATADRQQARCEERIHV